MGAARRRGDRGIALMMVLLVLAILLVLVAQMTATSLHNRSISDNLLADLQNAEGSESGYYRSLLFLESDAGKSRGVDSDKERWGRPEEFPLGRSRVRVHVQDSARFINLSTLWNDKGPPNPATVAQLRRLVAYLQHPPDIVDRIVDYIDADTKGSYEIGARNAPLYNVEELLRVEDLPQEVLYGETPEDGIPRKGILPFLTTWPREATKGGPVTEHKININTAPAEVLMSLSDLMDETTAHQIVEYRNTAKPDGHYQTFQTPGELKNVEGMSEELYASLANQISVGSDVFEVRVRSRVGNLERAWVYVVLRGDGGQSGQSRRKLRLLSNQRISDFLSVRPAALEE